MILHFTVLTFFLLSEELTGPMQLLGPSLEDPEKLLYCQS